jgi:hypothetical protein
MGDGDVDGPASSTDNAVARFDGTTGKLLQNSNVTIDDSGNLTYAVGTANGVAYLNGSKVLTTGSALTFDGTGLAVGNASPLSGGKFSALADLTLVQGMTLRDSATTYANNDNYVLLQNSTGGVAGALTHPAVSSLGVWGNDDIRFLQSTAATERARLTADGLEIKQSQLIGYSSYAGIGTNGLAVAGNVGVGTASPPEKLAVNGSIGVFAGNYLKLFNAGNSANSGLATDATGLLQFSNTGVTRWLNNTLTGEYMRLDSAGNLGLGVAPSDWNSGYKTFQVNTQASLATTSSAVYLANNFYQDSGGTNRYIATGTAGVAGWEGNIFRWYQAASGSAGAAQTTTNSMTLDASGNLLVGTTSTAALDGVKGMVLGASGSVGIAFEAGAQPDRLLYIDNGNGLLTFWNSDQNRADVSIDTSGNLLVGTTSLFDAERISVKSALSQRAAYFLNDTAAVTNTLIHNSATTGDNVFVGFGTEASYTGRGSITYNRGAGLVAYNVTSDYRAKDISGPVVGSGAVIDSVPVYMGKMKDATQERPMFIAHEVPAYAHTGEKDAVDAEGKPVYQQMDASALIPVMWAEIQDLRKRLAAAGI